MTLTAEIVHRHVTDRLTVRHCNEEEVSPAGGAIELDRAPLLDAQGPRVARDVGCALDTNRIQGVGEIRAVGESDDLDSRQPARGLELIRLEVERDGLLAADDLVSAPGEEVARRRIALGDLALQLQAAGLDRVTAYLVQQQRADAAPAQIRDDDEMRLSMVVGPGVDEAARGGSAVVACDEVHERLARCEVVAEVFEARRPPVGVGRGTDSNHGLEVAIGIDAGDREAGNGFTGHAGLLREAGRTSAGALRSDTEHVGHRITSRSRSRSDHSPRSDGVYAVEVLITVRLFAGLREQAGSGERVVDVPDGARIADVWSPLELGEQPPGLLFALNRRYAEAETPLSEGDEVALIPPVSGGAIRLSDEPIDPSAVVSEVADESAGAIATFIGTTRAESRGQTVLRLEYEAYEGMAEDVMAELAHDLKAKYELCEVAIAHRVGIVSIGEVSVAIAVSAPHRSAALDACKEAIDRLKEMAPVWKKEVYEGGAEWIGRGS
jgi:MoaE-MoaD fusion protein